MMSAEGLQNFVSFRWFCAKAPLVQGDDDDEVTIDSRQLKGPGEVPSRAIPSSAASATLKQRLSKKLSAIPAYLQTSPDPESLRLASTESSSTSHSGYTYTTL